MLLAQLGHARRKHVYAECLRRAHAHIALDEVRDLQALLDGSQQRAFHPLGVGDQCMAGVRQGVAATATVEQHHPQGSLQPVDAPRHRGVLDAELLSCIGDGTEPGHGKENSQVVPFRVLIHGSLCISAQ